MNIYIMKREKPEDLYSGKYYIEDYEEIGEDNLRHMLKRDPRYAYYKDEIFRRVLVVYYVGVAHLLEKKRYDIEFLAKRDYVSCAQARKNIKLEIAQNRQRRENIQIKKIDIAFEKKKAEFFAEYPFVVEGKEVKFYQHAFGKRIRKNESENESASVIKTIGNTTWKIDVWKYITRFKKNEKYWYYCPTKN